MRRRRVGRSVEQVRALGQRPRHRVDFRPEDKKGLAGCAHRFAIIADKDLDADGSARVGRDREKAKLAAGTKPGWFGNGQCVLVWSLMGRSLRRKIQGMPCPWARCDVVLGPAHSLVVRPAAAISFRIFAFDCAAGSDVGVAVEASVGARPARAICARMSALLIARGSVDISASNSLLTCARDLPDAIARSA